MAKRLHAMGNPRYVNNFDVTLHEDLIDLPRRWKRPRVIFVNSMSDLFHPDVPLEFIKRVFATMKATPQHTYQILTKRPEVAAEHGPHLEWTPNIWMGTSVENALVTHRIRDLQRIRAKVRFLSNRCLVQFRDCH